LEVGSDRRGIVAMGIRKKCPAALAPVIDTGIFTPAPVDGIPAWTAPPGDKVPDQCTH
jgi:hypothetical protein